MEENLYVKKKRFKKIINAQVETDYTSRKTTFFLDFFCTCV